MDHERITDRQAGLYGNTALCTRAHRAVKTDRHGPMCVELPVGNHSTMSVHICLQSALDYWSRTEVTHASSIWLQRDRNTWAIWSVVTVNNRVYTFSFCILRKLRSLRHYNVLTLLCKLSYKISAHYTSKVASSFVMIASCLALYLYLNVLRKLCRER